MKKIFLKISKKLKSTKRAYEFRLNSVKFSACQNFEIFSVNINLETKVRDTINSETRVSSWKHKLTLKHLSELGKIAIHLKSPILTSKHRNN